MNRALIIKLIFIAVIGLILGFTGGKYAFAGMFLDLDIGVSISTYDNPDEYVPRYLGNDNPIGIFRAGYQTGKYNILGPINISAHAYYEHISSISNNNDNGIDVIMTGIRFE